LKYFKFNAQELGNWLNSAPFHFRVYINAGTNFQGNSEVLLTVHLGIIVLETCRSI
jgi:hypothetical protein